MVNGVARCSSNLEFIVKMEPSPVSKEPVDGPLLESTVISTPNGMSYGHDGHIPCDHVARFTYACCIKEFNGLQSRVTKRWADQWAGGQ